MKLRSYIILLILFIFNLTVQAQKPELKFKHITTLNGLSDGFVKNIILDHQGFIWIATINGLNKYDGYSIRVFKNDREDTTSLVSSNVRYVYEDSKNNLWIATNYGIDLYNREKNNFIHFPETKKEFIRCILEDHNKDIWLSAEGCLFKLDQKTNKFKKFVFENFTSVIEYLYEDSNHNLWMGAGEGVGFLDPTRKHFSIKHDIKIKTIYAILEDSRKQMWFGSRGEGIVIYNPVTNSQKILQQDIENPNSLSSNKILSFSQDTLNRVWIGTEHGSLCLYEPKEDIIYNYQYLETDSESLLHNSIYNIYRDRNNHVWLSCFGGVEKLIHKKFKHIRANSLLKNTLSYNNVLCFYEDKQGLIWIGTDGGGLNVWNRRTGEFTYYRHNPKNPKSLGSDAILGIEEDENGNMLIATWGGGLNVFNPLTKEFTRLLENPKDPNSILSNNLYGLYKDKNNDFWAITLLGLDFYDKRKKHFVHYNIPKTGLTDLIGGLYEDRDGNFWVGSFNGLYILHRDSKTVTSFPHVDGNPRSLSNDQVYSVNEDSRGNLWVCTANGMNLFDKQTKTFTVINKTNGLPADLINGFLEDRSDNLWISTANGISVYNLITKKVRNYNVSDGLQGNTFSINALYKLQSGEMLFGGANGFNIIKPEKMGENRKPPPVVITDIKLFNESLVIDKHGSPLRKNVSLTDQLVLSYDQSVISFDFAALDYTASDKNQYAYMMENFEEKWNYVGDKRSATYTSLDPGTYFFRVKASNNDGIWNEQGATIKIIITPPYWQTWWFRTLVFSFIGLCLWLIYKSRVRNIYQQNVILEEKVKARTAEISAQKEELIVQGKYIEELYIELKDSIKAAQVIQNSILPPKKLIQSYIPECFILNRPKDLVGGDYYYFNTVDDKVILAAIDCTGHGVSGAFMSIIGYHLLNKIIESHSELSASEILNELNRSVINELNKFEENLDTRDGMDIALCIISPDGKSLQFAGANNPIYIVRHEEVIQIKANRFSIGKGAKGQVKKFTSQEVELMEGDLVYMFSDGYADQMGGEAGDEKFMYPRFRDLLRQVSKQDMNSQMVALDNNLKQWRNKTPQLDDVLVIGFKVC